MLIFYVLSPVPTMISKRYADSVEASSALIEMCIFITTGIVVSAYGLPIVLAHTPLAGPVVSGALCFEFGKVQGTHRTGKTGKMAKKNPCQGKHREFGHFV